MTTRDWVAELEADLRAEGDAERAHGAKAYLKSDLEFIGVAAEPLRAVARRFDQRHPEIDNESLWRLVQDLWQRRVYELQAVAVALLERRARELRVADLPELEALLRESHTWALVDWISTKIAAPIVDSAPAKAEETLRRWSSDPDFWLRRASMLALLPALRAGGGDFGLFSEFAATMLGERQFFIRKAIGWVLRDTSNPEGGVPASTGPPAADVACRIRSTLISAFGLLPIGYRP
jgi:3-methyladenine DNA glycosylase AlkD